MAVVARGTTARSRLRETAELLGERGFAVTPERLAALCLGGPAGRAELARALAAGELDLEDGLAVAPGRRALAAPSRRRADRHRADSAAFVPEAQRFAELICRLFPFVRGVALAGSLASGGFVATDDVDLNLLVDDGRRHLAYLCVNALGYAHALRWRRKPVDASSRRPLAPRVMTVNLVLERRQWSRLERVDGQMALELLLSRPLTGGRWWQAVVEANPALLDSFPQLARPRAATEPEPVLPGWLFPSALDRPAAAIGRLAWRWLQWTRRRSPAALARVTYVRSTMRPYTLFDGAP